jgi:hypothetical protein
MCLDGEGTDGAKELRYLGWVGGGHSECLPKGRGWFYLE